MRNSAEKVRLAGNPNVMVCERGTMFGYNDLIVDPRNLEWMREADCPVVADITHSLQQPAGKKLDGGGVASGGLRELIPCIARTAVAVGVDGIFMEVSNFIASFVISLNLCSNLVMKLGSFSGELGA
jgi:2-dehydro-3-deoxyphosphooctonate aldolase (KDO 8-P synthase)